MASCSVLERAVENRKRELTMQRRWLVAVAVWDPHSHTIRQQQLEYPTHTPTHTSTHTPAKQQYGRHTSGSSDQVQQGTSDALAGEAASDGARQQQQRQQAVRPMCGDLSPSWLVGAAGRLASHLELAPPGGGKSSSGQGGLCVTEMFVRFWKIWNISQMFNTTRNRHGTEHEI